MQIKSRSNDKWTYSQFEYAYLAAFLKLPHEIKQTLAIILERNPSAFIGSVSKFSNKLNNKDAPLTKLEEQVWQEYQANPISVEQAEQKLLGSFVDKIPNLQAIFDEKRLKLIYKIADRRYEDILKRVFDRSVSELFFEKFFLDGHVQNEPHSIDLNQFEMNLQVLLDPVSISRRLSKDLILFYKDMALVRVYNDHYERWYEANKSRYKEVFNQYRDSLDLLTANNAILRRKDFREFFKTDEDERFCSFCEISEAQIKQLDQMGEIHTKRFYSRGKTIEVDQIRPYDGYNIFNITLCCYWCNNAKTDEFSQEEFRESIAPGIRVIWQQRLKKLLVKKAV